LLQNLTEAVLTHTYIWFSQRTKQRMGNSSSDVFERGGDWCLRHPRRKQNQIGGS